MPSRSNGFTLLELLVALAVFGMLLVMMTQGVQFGLAASRAQTQRAVTDDGIDAVDLVLRHLIEAMDVGSETEQRLPLLASRDRMTFVTEMPNSGGGPVTRQIQATVLVDSRHRLVMRWQPFVRASPLHPAPPPVETELLGGVSHLDLAFWRRSGGWANGWRFSDLPAMVRVRLVFTDANRPHWPDIVVAPRLGPP